MFGFINSHRPVLSLQSAAPCPSYLTAMLVLLTLTRALSYTHDALPRASLASAAAAAARCADAPGAVARDAANNPLTCAALQQLCSSHPQLAAVCPRTCGSCRTASSEALADVNVRWQPLLWKNLPSHPHVAPSVSSPYHYR